MMSRSESPEVEDPSEDREDLTGVDDEEEDNISMMDAASRSNASEAGGNDEEEAFEHPEEKQRKSGVLYFSSIPPRYGPLELKKYFEKTAPGFVGRVYCERNKFSKSREERYTEGWLEIRRKKLAKRLALSMDNTPLGGKKSDYRSNFLWNIKYLNGFKWVHLMEQISFEKKVAGNRMAVEVNQARRIAAHFEEQVEKGQHLRKLEERVMKEGGQWKKFEREITQRKGIQKKKGKKSKKQQQPIEANDDLMKMIFAE